MLENGLYPAAVVSETERAYSGYAYIWVRDNIMIPHCQFELMNFKSVQKTLNTLIEYFLKYRHRFTDIIEGRADYNNPMLRPHVRFEGHHLEENNQKWAHAQNDALGYFLWLTCKAAQKGVLPLSKATLKLLALFPLYLEAIRYWQDKDSGHWEEVRKVEASSIGTVIAGLKELKLLLSIYQEAEVNCSYKQKVVTTDYLAEIIEEGEKELQKILPFESINFSLKEPKKYDSALLFLIYPLNVVSGTTADQILLNVQTHLQGEYGIKRYLGDSYWCEDYKKKLKEEERTVDFSEDIERRDALLEKGTEAQWCIFDPIISIIYGKKYIQTRHPKWLHMQTYYFNRSLGQVTGEDCPFGPFLCPESYYIENGRYVPNDITPLAWTQANLRLAFHYMELVRLVAE